MRRPWIAIAASLVLAACGTSSAPPPSEPLTRADAALGQRLAEIHCATCHAIGAEGESPHADAPAFRTLSQNYPITALEEAFAEGILVGHPDMPEFRLEPPEIDAIVAYIQNVQTPAAD